MGELAGRLRAARVRGAMKGLVAVAEDFLARAVADAPVDEGTLRESAVIAYIVDGVRYEGAGAAARASSVAVSNARLGSFQSAHAEVSFNTPYAAAQHEAIALMVSKGGTPYIWQARHYPGGGGPKFLERNLREHQQRYMRVIQAASAHELDQAG